MKQAITIFSIVGIVFLVSALSCNNNETAPLIEGEKLARVHCASCHAFPDPSLLDKKTWTENVLPLMGQFMNVDIYYEPYNNSGPAGDVNLKRVTPDNLFPFSKWKDIVAWYTKNAPEKPLPRKQELSAIQPSLKNFTAHPVYDVVDYPLTTFIRYDTSEKKILFGDGVGNKVFELSNEYKAKKIFDVGTGITDLNKRGDAYQAITMGILKPSDQKLGKLSKLATGIKPATIIDSLQRPVQAKYADLNGDGKEDIVISEFGYRNGVLSWFQNNGSNNNYNKHILRPLPGAIDIRIYDFNKDGKPDISALMAQGDEGVFFYYNEGGGKFREERVLQFPSSYGSNFFDLVDINKDGFVDIITNNGDNGDYSIILKAYHGVRIFLNDGKNKFTEKIFLPVYGVQKTLARDFDNDGDIDLASIAFFPDYANHADESFIYWENKGDLTFNRSTFETATDGRWMTMDANDIDGDGDIDILLGNAFFTLGDLPQSLKDKWKKRPLSVMVLENTLIKKAQ
jgi:FG-GAP-like repeat